MRQVQFVFAVVVSLGLHILGVFVAVQYAQVRSIVPEVDPPKQQLIRLELVVIPSQHKEDIAPPELPDQSSFRTSAANRVPVPAAVLPSHQESVAASPVEDRPRAFMDAPPAPTAQEWAMAATYTLKNSKRYRHNWGQQVRSMMGTAHDGPDQGAVRFRIEIAPNGKLAQLDTLWTTSAAAEQRARAAVLQMPPLPPTPNGNPLIFEKTIVFDAFTVDAPPLYKNDCEPEPLQHGNRFVWDGRSPQVVAEQAVTEKLDPAAYAECLKQLPQDSIEAEAASDERQLKQWGSSTLGR